MTMTMVTHKTCLPPPSVSGWRSIVQNSLRQKCTNPTESRGDFGATLNGQSITLQQRGHAAASRGYL